MLDKILRSGYHHEDQQLYIMTVAIAICFKEFCVGQSKGK